MPLTKEQIAENNKRVLEKWRNGDNLCLSTEEMVWFPPRGVFDKKKGRMVKAEEKPDLETK
jgi:hypothetical protein